MRRYNLTGNLADRTRLEEDVRRFAVESVSADLAADCAGLGDGKYEARRAEWLGQMADQFDDSEAAADIFDRTFAPTYGVELAGRDEAYH